MGPRRISRPAWQSFLCATIFLHAALAAAQSATPPAPSHLTDAARTRLADAARDETLAPWQRDIMLEVAREGVTAFESSPTTLGGMPGATRTAAVDGDWNAVPPPPPRSGFTAIYDPVRDRMVVFAGLVAGAPRNDVWALSLAGSLVWSPLSPTGTPPPGRNSHTAIYDPVRDRMVIFGGLGAGSVRKNDVWALSLAGSPAWTALAPVGTPPSARYGHRAFYDPVRDRMVVFGGNDGAFRNDVWALSLAGSPAWSAVAPSGSPPSGRFGHSAIYDPVRDRMVVFGGFNVSYFNDAWELSLAGTPAWSALAPAGTPPSARDFHTAIYDPVRDRMVVFGGYNGSFLGDAWALSLGAGPTWSALAPTGTPPSPRNGHAAFYDPLRDRMVAFGGGGASVVLNDAWELSLPGTTAWSMLTTGAMPPGLWDHTALYDALRDRMVVYGGSNPSGVWALSFTGNQDWSLLAPAGTPPVARAAHSAIYDPVRDRMIVFGGSPSVGYLNDVWTLSLWGTPTWTALVPAGAPPPARFRHSAIYDPVRDRMVVFGGYGGTYLNDVWVLSFTGTPTWSALTPSGTPPSPRQGHTAIYDPPRDRMVVFGGVGTGGSHNDVWELSLAGSPAWSVLAPSGSLPSTRYEHRAIYDPVRDRMVVFGGRGIGFLNDLWALSLAGTPAWSALAPTGSPPSGRQGHTAVYDLQRDRMVVLGGQDGSNTLNDTWSVVWGSSVSVPGKTEGRSRFELGPPRPNPSGAETFLEFNLGQSARVTLDVFDSQGRRVKRIADEWFTAGPHGTVWRGDDDRGVPARPGVYFVRMKGEGFQATRRIARIN